MIRSRTNTNEQVFDALSLSAELVVLGGNTRQQFYTIEQTYEDDRKWVPCILNGKVFVKDPANIMNGWATLTGIEWYTQMPIEGDYNTGRIVNPTSSVLEDEDVYDPETGELTHEAAWRSCDYLISDGSGAAWCDNVPNMCLIVHKNVPQLTAIPIFAVLKFVDERTGLTVRVQRSIDFSTEVYNTEMVVMKGDCSDEVLLDPLSFTDTIPSGQNILDIPWTRTINAQLVGINGNVPDNQACYLWCTEDSTTVTGWRPFTDDEINAMQLTGVKTKTLTVDVRMIGSKLRVRCYGCRRDAGDEWRSPLDAINPFYTTQLTMTLNDTLHADPVQIAGAKLDPTMSTPAVYEMNISYNNKPVPQNKLCLFLIHWKAQDLKTGVIYSMGTSPNLSFIPKDKGFSFPEGFSVWADVSLFNSGGVVVQDGNIVVEDNNMVVSQMYE